MGLTRRQTLIHGLSAGLGALALTGCASTGGSYGSRRPVANWPGSPSRPSGSNYPYTPVSPVPQQVIYTPHVPPAPTDSGAINAISRSNWTRTAPVTSKINAMNGISKLTVHHDGMDPSYFTDKSAVAQRLELIRTAHTRDRGWGDIGYHYIIDRAGRVWEGRPIQYQGAHVKNNNENNVGILVLGNFEKQSPSQAQLATLFETATKLTGRYKIRSSMVRSHQEINPTECPGRNLQTKMNALRAHVA